VITVKALLYSHTVPIHLRLRTAGMKGPNRASVTAPCSCWFQKILINILSDISKLEHRHRLDRAYPNLLTF
jgi:hypothetical protein